MIGVIVEGYGEIDAIRNILEKVNATTSIIKRPLHADLQPKAPPKVIARSAKTAINQLTSRGASKIIVLIDLEDSPCAVNFSECLRSTFQHMYDHVHMSVVAKNRAIENWLIADISALQKLNGRFTVAPELVNAVAVRADEHQHAARLLNRCAIRHSYHKGSDPQKITANMDLSTAALKSRSLRKFLREAGDSRFI